MTTIATDGKSMAGDGRITEFDRVCLSNHQKVVRLKDGRIVGFSGNAYNWDEYAAWLNNGGDPPKVHETFGALVLSPDGTLCSYDEFGRRFPEAAPYAIGSGSALAIGAMDAGMTAERACEIACARDVWSGGKITVLYLESPE